MPELNCNYYRPLQLSSNSSEDSSSCSGDSSTRMRIGGRQRLGVRMGTMRSRRHHGNGGSGVDYTSSSEQSCDTAIYVGSDGRSVSDREITDCEGPPQIKSRLTMTRQLSSSVPMFVPDATAERLRKEFEGFDDEVVLDEGMCSATSRNFPASSRGIVPGTNGSMQLPRSAGHVNGNGEMWIDGPRMTSSSPSSKVATNSVEQWVDGPPEFRLNGNGPPSAVLRQPHDVHVQKLVESTRESSPSPKATTSNGRSSQLPMPPQKHRRHQHRESTSKTSKSAPFVVEATVHHEADVEHLVWTTTSTEKSLQTRCLQLQTGSAAKKLTSRWFGMPITTPWMNHFLLLRQCFCAHRRCRLMKILKLEMATSSPIQSRRQRSSNCDHRYLRSRTTPRSPTSPLRVTSLPPKATTPRHYRCSLPTV